MYAYRNKEKKNRGMKNFANKVKKKYFLSSIVILFCLIKYSINYYWGLLSWEKNESFNDRNKTKIRKDKVQ